MKIKMPKPLKIPVFSETRKAFEKKFKRLEKILKRMKDRTY